MPSDLKNEGMKVEICKILNKIGALKFGAYKLSSGKITPYYIDLRIVPSFPDAFQKVCAFCIDFIKQEIGVGEIDRMAGIPVAGIPFASVIAYGLKKPFLYIQKGVNLQGRQRKIEGVIAPGDRILLIDDLITTGLSLQKATKAVTAEGGIVTDAVVLLDRQEGGKKKLAQLNIKLHALLNVGETAETLHELGSIDEEQLKMILKQVKKD